LIKVDPFAIPAHWRRINALDPGWDHPAGFAALAHDAETDTVYVYDAWKVRNAPVMQQCGMVLAKGLAHIPHAWPHDGLQHDKGSGEQLRALYAKFGLNMLPERAQFEPTAEGKPGGNSVEAGISMMLTRMQARQLRVFSHLNDWFDEFRLYHRKDGLIVKVDDDILSATRYGLMMLRKAKSLAELGPMAGPGRSSAPAYVPSFQVFDPEAGY
jgi:hypothetical protein